eukprot:CAMPEP_0179103224 /NCGR_PEP_ID=MMETSP0796-20121207/47817_1 /TAXON_ID=73915 /ORGANISM="Pyrodinium bahamense, Strain pbaha01" /LENGTH=207 /DNA_ID=CAMNT_0020801123 /DNA_START=249 /DNA_END=872 /DNA_ORIENTATION=-
MWRSAMLPQRDGPHSHPLPSCWQHHAFFSGAHAAFQLAIATVQSCGEHLLVVWPGAATGKGHPLEKCWQHHAFFRADHAASQLLSPISHWKGGGGAAAGGTAAAGDRVAAPAGAGVAATAGCGVTAAGGCGVAAATGAGVAATAAAGVAAPAGGRVAASRVVAKWVVTGGVVVCSGAAAAGGGVGHPRPTCAQHQALLPADHRAIKQ